MDAVVERAVIVEFKTVEKLLPVHEAQLLSYLKLSGLGVGLLNQFSRTWFERWLEANRQSFW